jgi:uncharacterized protein YqjF (DUF2071 family)
MRMRERPPGRAVMRQIWRELGFLHWPVAPDAIARLLPPACRRAPPPLVHDAREVDVQIYGPRRPGF